jgi:hypothetical protein
MGMGARLNPAGCGLKAKKCVWLGRVYRDLPAHPCWIPLPSSGLNAVS